MAGNFTPETQHLHIASMPLPEGAAKDKTLQALKALLPQTLDASGGLKVSLVSGAVSVTLTGTAGLALDATLTSGTQKTQVTSLPSLATGSNTIGAVNQGNGGSSAWKVDGSAVTQPVSAASLPLPTGAATQTTLAAILALLPTTLDSGSLRVAVENSPTVTFTNASLAVTQSGTWTVQPGNTANTTPWLTTINQGGNSAAVTGANALKVDGSAVTQPVSASSLPLPSGAATQTTLAAIAGQLPAALDGSGLLKVHEQGTANVSVQNASLPVTQSGTWTVQPGNTANTTPWLTTISQAGNSAAVTGANALKVDGSAVTQPVSGTVTANIGTSGSLALDATLTGGTQKAINRGGAKGSTTAADITSTASGANHQALDVAIYDGSGNQLGTSSNPLRVGDVPATSRAPVTATSTSTPGSINTLLMTLNGASQAIISATGDTGGVGFAVQGSWDGGTTWTALDAIPLAGTDANYYSLVKGFAFNLSTSSDVVNLPDLGGFTHLQVVCLDPTTFAASGSTGVTFTATLTYNNASRLGVNPIGVAADASSWPGVSYGVGGSDYIGGGIIHPVKVTQSTPGTSDYGFVVRPVTSTATQQSTINAAGVTSITVTNINSLTIRVTSISSPSMVMAAVAGTNAFQMKPTVFLNLASGTVTTTISSFAVGDTYAIIIPPGCTLAGVSTNSSGGSYTSGSVGLNLATSNIAQPSVSALATVGTSATSINPTVIGASDGTNIKTLLVDGSSNLKVAVQNTITANIGTSGSLALDASVTAQNLAQGSTTSGQVGTLVQGAVTTSAPSYTTAKTSPLSLTTAGALRVDGSAVTQPVSGTVTATQSTASSLNALVAQGANVSAASSAWWMRLTDGVSTSHTPAILNTPPGGSEYGLAVRQVDSVTVNGDVIIDSGWVSATATSTGGGASLYEGVAAASNNATSVKNAAGQVFGYSLYNAAAYAVFLKFYNKATSPSPGSDTPVWVVGVPASSQVNLSLHVPLTFGTGIAYAVVKGIANNDNTSVAASDCVWSIQYA